LFVFLAASFVMAQDVTIPLQIERGMPFVQVMVNGKGPFTFGIDTGTGGDALVSPELAERLQLPKAGEMQVGDPSGKNPQTRRVFQIASLKIAGVEFKNIEAVSHSAQPIPDVSTDGILGFNLFQDYLLTIDYSRSQLLLRKGALTPSANVVPFTILNGVPQIELNISGRKLAAHLDTRGQGFSIPAGFAQSLKFSGDPIVVGRGRTVSNEFEIKGAQLADDIEIAGFKLQRPFVVLNPVFEVGNIGSVVLRHFTITFDQNAKLVRFESAEKVIDIPPPGPPPQSK
jgi:hypothetical protein